MFDDKYNNVCLNCNKQGHDSKSCTSPITSWGIILVNVNNNIKINNHSYVNIYNYTKYNGIICKNSSSLNLINTVLNNISFLLVQRKHSLGFSEFIRGKYVIGNINALRGLFEQMVPDEIELIKKSDFDTLWNFFWGKYTTDVMFNKKEYYDSKNKFETLKSNILNVENSLNFYLDTTLTYYSSAEWGFPKGRKKKGETDLTCAIREFCEETNLSENDISILYKSTPIIEELTGTNGKKYKHIYYLAELKNKNIDDKLQNMCNSEIGNIGFYQYLDAYTLIRDYHVEKKNILTSIVNYYVDILKQQNTLSKQEEWTVT